MFRMLLQQAFRWIVALTTLAGSGALIGTTPLFQEAAPALELELADVEPPGGEVLPEIVVEPAGEGMSGLAFHPETMYRGYDECHEIYTVRGSLKNHGPGVLENIEITYTVPPDPWIGPVTLSHEPADSLDTSKPLRITMVVSTTAAWQAGGTGPIQIPLTATAEMSDTVVSTATATVHIYNACPDQDDEDPGDDDGDEDNDVDDGDGMGISGLVFHPGHLNSGGVCRTMYTARGSLKNHGLEPVTGVVLTSTAVVADGSDVSEWVTVTIAYDEKYVLTSSKPLRFTVNVSPDMDRWESFGKGKTIEITIEAIVDGDAGAAPTATMTVRNQCKENGKIKGDDPGVKGKPEKPDKPGKPDKSEKSDKPGKPQHPLEGGPPGQNKDKKNK